LSIEKYKDGLEELLSECRTALLYEIHFDKRTEFVGKIWGSVVFVDRTILYFREFVDVETGVRKLKYSYHYQGVDGKRIFRFDNVEHHPCLNTFPHHQHHGPRTEPDRIVESEEVSLGGVISKIETMVDIPEVEE
jgi:hypothetical protein